MTGGYSTVHEMFCSLLYSQTCEQRSPKILVFIDRWPLFEGFFVLCYLWRAIRVWPLLTGWSLLGGIFNTGLTVFFSNIESKMSSKSYGSKFLKSETLFGKGQVFTGGGFCLNTSCVNAYRNIAILICLIKFSFLKGL